MWIFTNLARLPFNAQVKNNYRFSIPGEIRILFHMLFVESWKHQLLLRSRIYIFIEIGQPQFIKRACPSADLPLINRPATDSSNLGFLLRFDWKDCKTEGPLTESQLRKIYPPNESCVDLGLHRLYKVCQFRDQFINVHLERKICYSSQSWLVPNFQAVIIYGNCFQVCAACSGRFLKIKPRYRGLNIRWSGSRPQLSCRPRARRLPCASPTQATHS